MLAALAGCIPSAERGRVARSTLVIGIDRGGDFVREGRYDSSMDFAANYLYAHLRGLGALARPTSVFVGSIDQPADSAELDFRSIETFAEMSVAQIAAYLRREFPPRSGTSEFTPFVRRVESLVKREDLVLVPLTVILLTDGLPAPAGGTDSTGAYAAIDLSSLEYLARTVTVRVLYPSPAVAAQWQQTVPRRRVRMLTVGNEVMAAWERHHRAGLAPEHQLALWRWIAETVDAHIRTGGVL